MFRHACFDAWPRAIWHTLLRVWGFFWTLMVLTAILDDTAQWWRPLAYELSSAVTLSLIVYLMLAHGMRKRHLLSQPRLWFWQHVKWLPAVSTFFVIVAYGLRHGLFALLDLEYAHEPWGQVWLYETMKLAIFLGLWLAVFYGIHVFVAAREQERNLQAMQRALDTARLQQLTAQLEPHFLFNTLNTISALMHSNVPAADRLLSQLADLLRARLGFDDRQVVTLEEELRLLRLYADIMCARYAPRVALEWRIDADALGVNVPVMLLQPLLENVFRHEVEASPDTVHVTIAAALRGSMLEVVVTNSVSNSGYRKPGSGIGLHNGRERLRALYGAAASLTTTHEGGTFGAILRVPQALPESMPESKPERAA